MEQVQIPLNVSSSVSRRHGHGVWDGHENGFEARGFVAYRHRVGMQAARQPAGLLCVYAPAQGQARVASLPSLLKSYHALLLGSGQATTASVAGRIALPSSVPPQVLVLGAICELHSRFGAYRHRIGDRHLRNDWARVWRLPQATGSGIGTSVVTQFKNLVFRTPSTTEIAPADRRDMSVLRPPVQTRPTDVCRCERLQVD
jgi:hypothetical protein